MAIDARYVARTLMVLTLLFAGISHENWTNRMAGLFALGMLQGVKNADFFGSLWLVYHFSVAGYHNNFSISLVAENNLVLGTVCAAYLWGLNHMKKMIPNPVLVE